MKRALNPLPDVPPAVRACVPAAPPCRMSFDPQDLLVPPSAPPSGADSGPWSVQEPPPSSDPLWGHQGAEPHCSLRALSGALTPPARALCPSYQTRPQGSGCVPLRAPKPQRCGDLPSRAALPHPESVGGFSRFLQVGDHCYICIFLPDVSQGGHSALTGSYQLPGWFLPGVAE